jgi:hypothetical protein
MKIKDHEIFRIWGSRSRHYEEFCFVGHNTMQYTESKLFQKNTLPLSPVLKSAKKDTSMKHVTNSSETSVDFQRTT